MKTVHLSFIKSFDHNHECFRNNDQLKTKIEHRFNQMRSFLDKKEIAALTTIIIDGETTYRIRVDK